MNAKPLSRLNAISFLQSFVTQSVKAATQVGCNACDGKLHFIEYLGLGASGCLEDSGREHAGIPPGPLTPGQYAEVIISIKNQIGGNFSRASSEPGVIRVLNTQCPFGDSVKEAPELCRMTSSVFGGIAARNLGYAKVELRRRIASNDGMCEVCIHLDRDRAADTEGDEYRLEGDLIVSRTSSCDVTVRVQEKIRQAWCGAGGETARTGIKAMDIVAESAAMRAALRSVELVGPTTAAVLISGETGVGKEVIARALHALSGRAGKEFAAVNCGAIPESLIESQLFGHERGAFTGAYQVHHGLFERAEKGTLFLDEINSLPVPAQARLLRVLQDGVYDRVGGKQPLRADVRIIAASNRSIEDMVARGEFRMDLYYRLNVVPIHIPPLRERKEDISALADRMLRRLAQKYATGKRVLGERAWMRIMHYDWPGNVRELENVLERAFIFARGPVIDDIGIVCAPPDPAGRGSEPAAGLRGIKKRAAMQAEDRLIREALTRFGGNVTAVARGMGITPRAVHQKLRAHGIEAALFRNRAAESARP